MLERLSRPPLSVTVNPSYRFTTVSPLTLRLHHCLTPNPKVIPTVPLGQRFRPKSFASALPLTLSSTSTSARVATSGNRKRKGGVPVFPSACVAVVPVTPAVIDRRSGSAARCPVVLVERLSRPHHSVTVNPSFGFPPPHLPPPFRRSR